jgi:hypothetical protein
MKTSDVSWVPKNAALRLAATHVDESISERENAMSPANGVLEITKILVEKLSSLENKVSILLDKESVNAHNFKVS